jgi:hypothetical protein
MRLEPLGSDASLVVSGKIQLNHKYQNYPTIACWMNLRLTIPSEYPRVPPVLEEIGGVIPKNGDFHVNPDGTICLGSPFRLHIALAKDSCINKFYQIFFIPYAYAALLKLQHNIDFIFGELSHGSKGELEDFSDIFCVEDKESVVACLKALSQKKRIANKCTCPCGCGKRLGACKIHYTINQYRNLVPRKQYSKFAQRFAYQ